MMCDIENSSPEILAPVTLDGRTYEHRIVIQRKYSMNKFEILSNIRRGLPFVSVENSIYINENDLHRYFSGEIGE